MEEKEKMAWDVVLNGEDFVRKEILWTEQKAWTALKKEEEEKRKKII